MTSQRLQLLVFSILLVITAVIVLLMFFPYFKLLAFGGILAILFSPVYKKLHSLLKSEPFAALVTIIVILFIVIIPLYVIGQLLFNEIIGVYNNFKQGDFVLEKSAIINSLPVEVQGFVNRLSADLGQKLSGFAANAFSSVTNIVSNMANFVLSFFLLFFSIYYFLRDNQSIRKFFNAVFPISIEHENILVTKLENAVSGVVKGSFLVALIQGAVATLGFFIFGVPGALLWGAFTVLAALVPNVGTSISIVPAILYLFITGHVGAGIGLAIWGAVAVGTIDNIISPKLIGSKVKLHPLLVLFSVIGGIQFFGLIGFLLGPIIMSVFMAFIDIYKTDLKLLLEK